MKVGEVLESLTEFAKMYRTSANDSIHRNNHMNNSSGDNIKQEDVDALLVDFINYIGARCCVDYGLYTKDLIK